MMLDIDGDWVIPILIAGAGAFATLNTRAVNAENKTLKTELELMKTQHRTDIIRIEGAHDDIWQEMKTQRESLAQNREAVIRLNSSIERLNDILPRLEQVVMGMAGCDGSSIIYNRRSTDPKARRHTDSPEDIEGPTDI